jgi:hypothetical protein
MLTTCDSDEDDLLPEYEFDYAKAKPNRLAMPELPIAQQQEIDWYTQPYETNPSNVVTQE